MNSLPRFAGGPIQMTGIGLFGGLSLVLVIGKLLGLWGSSWWWMVLPLLVFVVFNAFYSGARRVRGVFGNQFLVVLVRHW